MSRLPLATGLKWLLFSVLVIEGFSMCAVRKSTFPFTLETLIGEWENVRKEDGAVHTEVWTKQNDSTLIGFGLLMKGADTVFSEKLRIEQRDTTWFYVADVAENTEPTFFQITHLGQGEFIAVNPAHDFPKRISYQVDAHKLHAEVSDGAGNKIEYDFVRK
ncbi:MAG: hypothetical protein H6608_00485 [Flavobacteriales bacterium]|nr:hypothetical protein [Bacteroidota bacterium]MCB9239582.1 hypothetical protein [Flavobacteriales bacterium]